MKEYSIIIKFQKDIRIVFDRLLTLAIKVRSVGFKPIEENISQEQISERNPIDVGLQFLLDGRDALIIESWYNNLIEGSYDDLEKITLKVIKTGILSIQEGKNPRLITMLMDSCIPLKLRPSFLNVQNGGVYLPE